MGHLGILSELLVILALSLVVVTALRRIHVPAIAGLIVVGALIGPQAFGVVGNAHDVELLAEVGVALLLFGIGLEINLGKLKQLWRPIMVGGPLQVGLTIAGTAAVGLLMGERTPTAIFLGFVVAASSTAIVLRGLAARGEIDAPHGRLSLGILVFQDLAVIPMMLAMPILSGSGTSFDAILLAFLKTIAILAGVLGAAWFVVPRALDLIARTRQRDLFVLAVILASMGTAWVVSLAGVSLALGAFLAGLVVGGSGYRHQAMADLIPFRELFTSFFFVSVGMLLDPTVLWEHPGPIGLLLVAVLLGKFAAVFAAGMAMRLPARVVTRSAAALCQIGEFSFILLHSARGTGLVPEHIEPDLLAVAILTMLITPLMIAISPSLAAGVGRLKVLGRVLDVRTAEDAEEVAKEWEDHVLIAGYGVAGQELARALQEAGISFAIVDLNPDNIRTANERGEPAFFGDVTSPEVLEHLGIHHAREVVVAINDPSAAERCLAAVRSVAPEIHVVVRSRYLNDVESLLKAGASAVVPAELEAAVALTSHVLKRHGADEAVLRHQIERIRMRRSEESGAVMTPRGSALWQREALDRLLKEPRGD